MLLKTTQLISRKMLRLFNLRGDEMTMDSAASFLLEGVLKLVGAPNRFS